MNSLFEQLTNQMREAIESAISLSLHSKNQEATPLHVLWGLITNSASILNQVFTKMNIDKSAIELEVKSEIQKLMPIFNEVASKLVGKERLLVIPPHLDAHDIAKMYGNVGAFTLCRNTYEAFDKSEFAFICSGTATLEAALVGVPFVLAYKAKAIDYWLAKKFVKLKHVGLANILFDFSNFEPLHEELLQEDVSAENLLRVYEATDKEAFVEHAKKLRGMLEHGAQEAMIKIMKV